MRKDFGAKPWVLPQPVLIIGTYDENDKPNAMNAAWGGTYDFDKVIISLSKHKSTENIKIHNAFTLSFATKSTVIPADFVGIVSGNNEPKKMEKSGLHAIPSNKVHAPLFEEFPITMECEVDKYDEDEGILIGHILNVSVDEKYIKNGKVDSEALEIIAYDPTSSKYRLVKEAVADAFKCGQALK